jgi:hypothetical protein
MSDELKDISLGQIAVRVAFACVATALLAELAFLALRWLFGAP